MDTKHHPMGSGFGGSFSGDQVTSYPGQATVDESGQADNTNPNYDGGRESGATTVDTKGELPRPEKRPFTVADSEVSYDPLALLDSLHATAQVLNDALKRVDAKEDSRIKERMRGPIVVQSPIGDGTTIPQWETNTVPEGEIWIINQVVGSSFAPATTPPYGSANLLVFVDSLTIVNFIGLADSTRSWGNSILLRAGQKLVFTTDSAPDLGVSLFARVEYVSVSSDMVNDLARY